MRDRTATRPRASSSRPPWAGETALTRQAGPACCGHDDTGAVSTAPDRHAGHDVDCGEDLFPGHRVVLRGLVDGGRSRDDLTGRDARDLEECQVVGLSYELLPGVTRAEEAAREGRPFTLDATYDADVPLPWSTGGAGPEGLPGPSSVEVPDEDVRGGESTLGELGPWPVPAGAQRLTFWLHPVDGRRATGAVTVDLTTGTADWTPT